ncbi:tail assembly chaperone [Pseudanabaena phage Pam5]|nr:tail assembly chaperone [Pseudanabaena phage Pam5]
MSATDLITTINGKQYKVRLGHTEGRAFVSVRVRREMKDGTVVWAFLSHRQGKVESQARQRFADEIDRHLAVRR